MLNVDEHSAVSLAVTSSHPPSSGRYSPPPLQITPHPAWLEQMLHSLNALWEAACWPSLFQKMMDNHRPPLKHWQRFLCEGFLIVENFPKYMGMSLAKTTYGKRPGDASVRRWFLQNLSVEAKHAEWWIDWMRALGVEPEMAFTATPRPEWQALHEHLFDTCRNASLAEGVAASNWAIEGITGVWSRRVEKSFRAYADDGIQINYQSMMWLKAHARYDDAHPHEALEILKQNVDETTDHPRQVEAAARKSLVLFTRAVEACCID